jgi:hypothetical protein
MEYIEIHNNEIIYHHPSLPVTYKNISNFFALEPELLLDLGWSGNEGVKFYPYIEQRPELPENSQLIGPTYTIDEENKRVIGTYEVVEVIPATPIVPESITATQIRLWLIENNFSLSNIDNLIQSIEDQKTREKVMTEWEYAPYILRNHPFISTIGSALGLDDSQIDQAFIEASNIGN